MAALHDGPGRACPQIAEQEASLITAWYDAYSGRLRRFLVTITRDPSLAEDLAQEAFLRLIREVQAGRIPDNVGGWLNRVALNLVASGARHAAVARRLDAQAAPIPHEPSPEIVAEHRERADALLAALSALDSADREVILFAARGHSRSEMARRDGRTVPAMRTHLCRARAKLRMSLAASA
jgi:RNA polymerase sigma-70 factor (ECF subfamily)